MKRRRQKTDYQFTNPNNLLCLPVGAQVEVNVHGGTTLATVVDNRDSAMYQLEHHKTGVLFRCGRYALKSLAKFKRPKSKTLTDMMKEIVNDGSSKKAK